MMKALVIGASGQVGYHLLRSLKKKNIQALGTYWTHPLEGLVNLDVQDHAGVKALLDSFLPDVIFMPAAMANVDYCENHPQETRKINIGGLENVLAWLNSQQRLVYFSTDYIFNGEAGPYSEDAQPDPICEYGKQKLVGEGIVFQQNSANLVIRTTNVYGWEPQGKNYVSRLVASLSNGDNPKAPSDQIGNPTYAPNLADAVIELVQNCSKGVYNIAGPDRIGRYEFAARVAAIFGFDPGSIVPVLTADLHQIANRPRSGGFDLSKANSVLKTTLLGSLQGLKLMKSERI